MAERYTPEQQSLLDRLQGGTGIGAFLDRQYSALDEWRVRSKMKDAARENQMYGRVPTQQDWIDAQPPPSMGGGLQALRGLPPGFTLTPNGPVPGPGPAQETTGLPAGWNGTMPGQGAVRKAEAAQALAGGDGEGSILPYTGMPRFLTELGLRLAASKNPNFISALGESGLGALGASERADEKAAEVKIAQASGKRQALLAQAQVNQLNASAMEAMDRIGKPRDVKMITTGDGVVAAVQDGNVKIIIDPRTGKPMRADDPDSLKVLNALIEANFGDMDAISENIGQYTKVIKDFRNAGSTLYEPKEGATLKSGPKGNKTPGGYTVRQTSTK